MWQMVLKPWAYWVSASPYRWKQTNKIRLTVLQDKEGTGGKLPHCELDKLWGWYRLFLHQFCSLRWKTSTEKMNKTLYALISIKFNSSMSFITLQNVSLPLCVQLYPAQMSSTAPTTGLHPLVNRFSSVIQVVRAPWWQTHVLFNSR